MGKSYLLRNKDGEFLGNSPVFWKKNNLGYTQWIDDARLFTEEQADELIAHSPNKWEKFDAMEVLSIAKKTIDIQDWYKLQEAE